MGSNKEQRPSVPKHRANIGEEFLQKVNAADSTPLRSSEQEDKKKSQQMPAMFTKAAEDENGFESNRSPI